MGERFIPPSFQLSLRATWLVGSLLWTGSTAAALETTQPEPPRLVFARPLGTPAVVRWQARTLAPGARFRLFRGAVGGPLGLVAEIEAKDGVRSYRVRDDGATGFNQVYELRVVSPDGREVLLRRVSCRRFDAGSPADTAGGDFSRPLAARLREVPTPAAPVTGESGFLFGPPDPFSPLCPEPLLPPPREASAPVT